MLVNQQKSSFNLLSIKRHADEKFSEVRLHILVKVVTPFLIDHAILQYMCQTCLAMVFYHKRCTQGGSGQTGNVIAMIFAIQGVPDVKHHITGHQIVQCYQT